MLSLKESNKLNNSFSYKLIFEKLEDRNKKRMSQFSKRKTALSSNKNKKEKDIKKLSNLTKNNEKEMNEKDVINIFNLIINGNNNEIKIEQKIIEKIDNLNINLLPETLITKNNNINKINNLQSNDHNGILSNQKNNIKNISNSNNTNINNINEINKEINISNLEEEKEILSNNIYKHNENNEYALKFLSSTNDPFIQLGNNLITKVKIQKNYFTESYSQALGCDLENSSDNNKIFNIKKLDDIETIKEEKEHDTPLKAKNKGKIECQNDILPVYKKIKIIKEKRKSKSLNKELIILNQKDKEKKNIYKIINSIPNRNKNNDNPFEKILKKTKTKLQLFSKKTISREKKNKINKIINKSNNDNLKNDIKFSLTQKISNKNLKDIISNSNKKNQTKSVMNIGNYFYNVNILKSKFSQKKIITNYTNNNKYYIRKYSNNSKGCKNNNTNYKRKKVKYICIRKSKNIYNNNIGHSDDENNIYKIFHKNINYIKNIPNNNSQIEKNENKYNNDIIYNNYNGKNISKVMSINNSILKLNDNNNNIDSFKKKKKIQSIKLINNNIDNHHSKNNNFTSNNNLSPKNDIIKINKISIQSPFTNKIIKINKPLLNRINKINIQNQNIFKSNKIFKKNISFYGKEEKETIKKNEDKIPYSSRNKKNSLNRTIFYNNINLNQKKLISNYINFNRDSLYGNNNILNKSKLCNKSFNNSNNEKLKPNKSFYLYIDINSLKKKNNCGINSVVE